MSNATDHLLSNMLSSVITMEVNMLFRKNPNLVDSLEGVAKKIGQARIDGEVKKLVDVGLLEEINVNGVTIYKMNKVKAEDIDKKLAEHFRSAMAKRRGIAGENEHQF